MGTAAALLLAVAGSVVAVQPGVGETTTPRPAAEAVAQISPPSERPFASSFASRSGSSSASVSLSPSPSAVTSPSASSTSAAARAAALQAAREAEAVRSRGAAAAKAARDAQRDPRSAARSLLDDHGWGSGQFACLDALWTRESRWKHTARNASSGAYGIPQALPAGKLASAGPDWRTNPVTQIRWGLEYIDDTYGSPCGAWAHSRATNWY